MDQELELEPANWWETTIIHVYRYMQFGYVGRTEGTLNRGSPRMLSVQANFQLRRLLCSSLEVPLKSCMFMGSHQKYFYTTWVEWI
jgi:hypothetical protein